VGAQLARQELQTTLQIVLEELADLTGDSQLDRIVTPRR
jgi:hypothetical protein